MDEFQSEKEQVEELKRWWSENGRFVLTGLILGVGALAGWRYYNQYVETRAWTASAHYEQLLRAVASKNRELTLDAAGRLQSEFAATPYAHQAGLALAKFHMDAGEPDEAAAVLRTLIDKEQSGPLVHVARLRLAQIHLATGNFDGALGLLDNAGSGEFAARYHELRGDAYTALGDATSARREYRAALDAFRPGYLDRNYVEMKLNDLATADDPQA